MIRGTFLPRLFFEKTKSLSPIVGALSTMKVKKYGLGILNPVTSVNDKYLSSQRASAELIRGMTGAGEFFNAYHLLFLRKERRDGQKKRDDANDAKLKGLFGDPIGTNRRLILRTKNKGPWLST